MGATGGVGKTVALEFGKAGSDVAIMYRSKEDLAKTLAEDIERANVKASIHQCDVTDPKALEAAIADAIKTPFYLNTVQLLFSSLKPWEEFGFASDSLEGRKSEIVDIFMA